MTNNENGSFDNLLGRLIRKYGRFRDHLLGSKVQVLIEQADQIGEKIEERKDRISGLEQKFDALQSLLDMRFQMVEVRVSHLERALGFDGAKYEDSNTPIEQMLEQRLRRLEMRTMQYLEGPYLDRIKAEAARVVPGMAANHTEKTYRP